MGPAPSSARCPGRTCSALRGRQRAKPDVEYLFAHPDIVGKALAQHVWLSFAALALALVVAIPLGVLAARSPAARTPIFALLGVIYTIPSLALFALLIPALELGFTT